MKKILALVLCLIVAAGGSFIVIASILGLRYKNGELLECYISTGGGMLGGYSFVKLQRGDDGVATVTVTERETHADREITTTYRASADAFDRVRGVVNSYRLYNARYKKKNVLQILDGDTTTIELTYSKGSFEICDTMLLSHRMSEGFGELVRLLPTLTEGEGTVVTEPQQAKLYLKSGYTLRFFVEDAFDGRLDAILGAENEVGRSGDYGISFGSCEDLDVSGAEPVDRADVGTVLYDPGKKEIVLLYRDHVFDAPVYILARLDGDPASASPLIADMQGEYGFRLN